jgi:SSS family solute:Na+ symporter
MGTTTGMDLTAAITLAAVIVILYTAVGGLLADVYSDFVQGIAIVIGLLAMLVVIVIEVGGPVQALAKIEVARLAPIKSDQSLLAFLEQWAIPICGSLVAVELISRVLACKSADVARTATWLGGVGYLLVALIPVFLGLVGPQLTPGLGEAEQIVPTLAQRYLPAALYVMFAGALISAILSTVDSALLASASLVSHNIVLRLRPSASERVKVGLARAGVAVFGLIAFALALQSEAISDLVELASAFATAGIFVAFAFGLFTRWGGAASAYAAIVAGALVWACGRYAFDLQAPYVCGVIAAVAAYAGTAVLSRVLPLEPRPAA